MEQSGTQHVFSREDVDAEGAMVGGAWRCVVEKMAGRKIWRRRKWREDSCDNTAKSEL